MISFLTIVVLLTGSKKALFIILLFALLYYILTRRTKKIRYLVITIVGLTIVYYLIYNVPTLYMTIGLRIDQFIFSLTQISTGDRTGDLARLAMMEEGWKYFIQRPLFGHGAWNYAYLNGVNNASYIYSHNNYIELLVGYGIIGVILYYYSYFHLLKRNMSRNGNRFTLCIVLCLFMTDIAFVSYYSFFYQMILIICFKITKIENTNLKVRIIDICSHEGDEND